MEHLTGLPQLPPPRQTQRYLRELFARHHLTPKNKLGQSFLIDLNLLELMVRTAELGREDFVLEVGTGTGSLTVRLAEAAGAVLSVEIDGAFHKLAKKATATHSNVLLMHADVLKNKNTLNPAVVEALSNARSRMGTSRLKLVANLPYAVATPVIANLLISDFEFAFMVVMVQLEIADRLLASPGSKDYGALSVLVQSLADVEPVRRCLPPAVFWPRPKVASAIVAIRPDPARRALVGDVGGFRRFLRDLYAHRRKNLRGALAALPGRMEKPAIDRILSELGIPGTVRAEELGIHQHLLLRGRFG